MTLSPTWIGIDVSKEWLDIAIPTGGKRLRIANTAVAIAAFTATLEQAETIVVFEATGVYDAVLRNQMALAGIGFVRVNPQRARDFARATGRLAKTDTLDAGMLAEMGRALRLTVDPLPDPMRERLAQLSRRRDQLVAMRTQERLRRTDATEPTIVADLDQHLAWLSQAIEIIEAETNDLFRCDPELAADEALVRTVPGVGPVTAAVLVASMPELGRRSSKQIAMLAGLAPLNNDSGTSRGHRTIRGGRRRVRQALYMAAVASLTAKSSPFPTFYKRLRDAGKPAKLALIAVARKLLITINAIIKNRTAFAS
jgi:transposase